MQLCQAQRQLLSRCTLRCYSVGSSASNVVAAAGTSVPPRLKRPLASSFGGISIQNVVVPPQSVPQGPRTRTNRPLRSDGSNNKSPGTRRTGQPERYGGVGRPSALSGWDDGLVSLTFSSRLKQHQKKMTTHSTGARPEEAQSRRQHPKPAQRPQMHGSRHGQKEQTGGSQARRRTSAEKPATATQQNREGRTAKAAARATSMTRPSASSFKIHARSQSKPTPAAAATRKITPDAVATQTNKTTTTTTGASADRTARLTALSSTNLNALFRTRDTPIAGIPLPAHASTTARVRSVLERSAGDYSRFLPRRAGVRKNVSRLSALRTARHALAVQRDVSFDQRRVALHIIGGLAQPRRQARA
ncbi:hypothetical protein BJV78DRAFT_1195510 [Lactifluus subvellereus]|nr:hypothetical protein BJV78DRAFT_1195510 [Lactifluus subvellereus]